jgi:protein-tyrosine phosphatase
MRMVLFLCTGNYYRSRFAELLFNALAMENGLAWQADSRGLALEKGVHNIGPISVTAVNTLRILGVHLPGTARHPLQVQEQDFRQAALVIALKEAEHRPYVSERYPAWVNTIEYWHVHDGHPTAVYNPLTEIEREVRRLIQRLSHPA